MKRSIHIQLDVKGFGDGGRSFGKDDNTVSNADGFTDIMCNEDGSNSFLADLLTDVIGDIQACLIIKGRERLIQQEKGWLCH